MTPQEFAQKWYSYSDRDGEENELRVSGLARQIERYFVARGDEYVGHLRNCSIEMGYGICDCVAALNEISGTPSFVVGAK